MRAQRIILLCIRNAPDQPDHPRHQSRQKCPHLIDELARTTNPAEGKAIVNAVLDFLTENEVRSLITSHYSGIQASCRKLRVKGFMKEKVKGTLTIHNINEYIDYSLIEDNDTSVPQEAMRIARILGVDENLLDRAEIYLHQE